MKEERVTQNKGIAHAGIAVEYGVYFIARHLESIIWYMPLVYKKEVYYG